MIRSLLIANRGEIACRVIRSARKMGLRTIAAYSEADRDALHVRQADAAVAIGPAPARESYLRVDRIIDAAKIAGADAIHPGYGFLSEKPELADACEEAGLIWVGPNTGAVRAMGSKIEAKKIATEEGVAVVPGYSGADQSEKLLAKEAGRIGFPLMIKASAGGGGKGMRIVREPAGFADAVRAARGEAERSFGDGRLLIEKLIANPRHIEVQILGDRHGNIVHLYERDCSVQRNHQKLLEEAPAPNLSEKTRQALFASALKLANRIEYDSAGTVEFIVDARTEEFYFLEMNTRLQVEHTVTEEITGIDLVEMQLRIAVGENLPFEQEQIQRSGHAIEARLTAEDPSCGFRPDTGTIHLWAVPDHIRVDGGVETGSEVSPHYDSMLAKLIAQGRDRTAALAHLETALEQLVVLGPATNRSFLLDALRTETFGSGHATTGFINETWPDGWRYDNDEIAAMVALVAHLDNTRVRRSSGTTPWQQLDDFRLLGNAGARGRTSYRVDGAGSSTVITVEQDGERFHLDDGETARSVKARLSESLIEVTSGGVTQKLVYMRHGIRIHLGHISFDFSATVRVLTDCAHSDASVGSAGNRAVAAPMHGTLAEIRVAEGDEVSAGQTVAVLESMKLLMDLQSPVDGHISSITAQVGETLGSGQTVMTLADPEADN
ncbi:biotin carboxylase N-terminal domain-containing protein [Hoeflea sp. TYP-13]|uniref:acetyl/propionyl/methylcrotonyl-CoA carboxylase subunit alpha n=1 Tax=Hoeflea sp. TYP-13 TaxID=3230023 RepID=UPI0034C6BD40